LPDKFTDTSTEFLFGETINSLSPANEFLDAFRYSLRGMGARLSLGKLMFLYHDRKWTESIKTAHTFVDRYVDKAMEFRQNYLTTQSLESVLIEEGKMDEISQNPGKAEIGERHVLLYEMAKETGNREHLRSQILHVLLAGHGSSAITVGNAIFHLCRNPTMWDKLREEVLSVRTGAFTSDGLKNMHYLQYIIKETLRLHPVAPLYSRIAYQDTILPAGGGSDGTAPVLV
jgi:cytochrome P450